ncbi:GntR family transcriptional regulator [Castellaniella sp. GW247-6E4]|uniref:GntR family transcriptional regulator n=1 Tax=Castellaniella sp. GW247-6E4 TaxID=3140380 RepID=UPI0033161C42
MTATTEIASSTSRPQTQLSASDKVFWGIVRGLETQQFVPGQRLVEADLAARFHVGRNVVREAMQRLAAEGLVDLSRHKSVSVRILSRREAFDLLDIVERILGLLTRTATRACQDPGHAEELESVLGVLSEAYDQRDSKAFAAARRTFYRILLNMGGNRDLNRLFTTIHLPILYAQQRIPALQQIRLADYQRIVAAVLSGDEEAADEAGRLHVQNVRKALQELEASVDRGDLWPMPD